MTKSVVRRYLSPARKMEVMRRQDFKCKCCGDPLPTDPRDIEFDHIVELWEGGTNDIDNYAALNRGHHLIKTKRKTKERAKVNRLAERGGRGKMTVAERELAKLMERT